MVDVVRYADKFESIDALTSQVFPGDMYEYQPSQAFRGMLAPAFGADYAHDFGGRNPWAVNPGDEDVRFFIFGTSGADADSQFDALAQKCRRIGLGKLFTIDQAGTRRWAYARFDARPAYRTDFQAFETIPSSLHFIRLSDWFAAAATTGSQLCNLSPETFIINNPGNLPAKFVTFRIRANAAGGFTNPSILNTENDYTIGTLRDSTGVNDEVRITQEFDKVAVEHSTDDGATYADDYANVVIGGTQVAFMKLEPGDNDMSVTCGGTPDFNLEWSFYACFA